MNSPWYPLQSAAAWLLLLIAVGLVLLVLTVIALLMYYGPWELARLGRIEHRRRLARARGIRGDHRDQHAAAARAVGCRLTETDVAAVLAGVEQRVGTRIRLHDRTG